MSGARPSSDDTDRLQPSPDQHISPPRNSEKPAPARYIVEAEMTTVKLPVLTPKPDFLKVIHLGGGVGQTFTMAEIIQHVKEYIRERTLYDLQDPRIVHCGGDLLGKALNVESFTIHEAIALFRKNCTCRQLVAREVCSRTFPTPSTTAVPSSTSVPSSTAVPSPSAPRTSPSSTSTTTVPFSTTQTTSSPSTTRTIAFSSNRGTPSSSTRTLPSPSFTTQPSSISRTLPSPSITRTAPSHLSTSSVTDSNSSRGSHFPHSFNKNTSLPGSRIYQTFSSHTSVPQPSSSSFPSSSLPFSSFSSKFKAADAVVIITKENLKQSEVVTSSDDERHKGPGAPGCDEPDSAGRLRVGEDEIETDGVDQPGGDTVVLAYDSDTFSVEYEIESSSDTDVHIPHDDQDQESDVSSSTSGKSALLIVCKESDVEYLADYSDSDNGSDAELSEADKWLCQTCNTKNPPFQRNCSGCWSIRLDWLPTSTSRPEPASAHEEIQTANSSSSETQGCSQTLSQDSTKVKSSQDKDLTSDSCDCQDSEMASPPLSQSATKRDESCVVCLTRKKTASIIHGKTGHQVCCYRCAKKLKRQRKSCPICRRPIQKVIRNFHL